MEGRAREGPLLASIHSCGAERSVCMWRPGREMSVAEYFASTGRRLRFPNLPCANVGDRRRAVYIPVELCT